MTHDPHFIDHEPGEVIDLAEKRDPTYKDWGVVQMTLGQDGVTWQITPPPMEWRITVPWLNLMGPHLHSSVTFCTQRGRGPSLLTRLAMRHLLGCKVERIG